VRTWHQLEPLGDRVPLVIAAAEPSHVAHGRPALPAKIADCTGAKKRGVEAGTMSVRGAGLREAEFREAEFREAEFREAGSPSRRFRGGQIAEFPV
jgi:hypothetical protein